MIVGAGRRKACDTGAFSVLRVPYMGKWNNAAAMTDTLAIAPQAERYVEPGFKPLRAIGLMSGTSMDEVDAAYLETDGSGVIRAGAALTVPFAPDVRARLKAFSTAG